MNLSLESYRRDPNLRARIEAAARRERAQAVFRLLAALFKALLRQPPLRASRMLRRSALG